MNKTEHNSSIAICNKINNFFTIKRTSKSINLDFLKFGFTTLLLLIIQSIYAHGTVTSPPSRVWNCYQENPESPNSPACIAAVASHGSQPLYDFNEINQGNANGQHMLYVKNGNLPSGGRPNKYGGMDQVRTDWAATSVSPGAYTVTWTNSAPHATAYYEVYITKESWTPDQPLTWESLELLVKTTPSGPASIVNIPVNLPQRTGKHVIYSIWQRSDSPEAFYSTSDVNFGSSLSIDNNEKSSASVLQNFPNPFSLSSNISYTINKEGHVSLKVYDVLGKEVTTLVDGHQNIGKHEVIFNRKGLNSGVYFYVFKLGNYIETKKMIFKK